MKTTKFHLVLGIGLGVLAAAGLSLGITQNLGGHDAPAAAETLHASVATFDSAVAPTIVDRYDRGLFDTNDSRTVAPTIVDRYDRGLFDSEFSVVAPTIVDRYDRGLFDTNDSRTVAPTIVDRYDRSLFDSTVAPSIVDRYDRGLFDEVLP